MTGTDAATVLIVDDEPATADLYAEMLGETYDIVTAYGGKPGLESLDESVDVVLVDRRMPDLHGDELLEELRARDVDCRVVMVTAIDPALDIIGLEFDDYLVKPVSMAELDDVVRRMLTRQAHDDPVRDALALASKLTTLEAQVDDNELEASPDYHALLDRFDDVRKRLEAIDRSDTLAADLQARLDDT